MLNIDQFPFLYWDKAIKGNLGLKNLSNITRHNNKILMDAQDRSTQYIMKRNRLGWTFESLMRSIGLAGGSIFGGAIGGATLAAIGGGIGRGVGEHFGNNLYGKNLHDLDQVIQDHKFRQLNTQYATKMALSTKKLVDEMYKQSYQMDIEIARDLGQ